MSTVTKKDIKQADTNALYTNITNAQDGLLDESGVPIAWALNSTAFATPGGITLRDMGTLKFTDNNTRILKKIQHIPSNEIGYIQITPDPVTAATLEWAAWIDGSEDETNRSTIVDTSGFAYVVGYSNSSGFSINSVPKPYPSTSLDMYVVKYTPLGSIVWVNWIGGLNDDLAFDVATDATGNVYVAGQSFTSGLSINTLTGNVIKPTETGNSGNFLVKYTSVGITEWAKWIDGSGAESFPGCATDPSGNVYISGATSTCGYTINTTTQGNVVRPVVPYGNNAHYIVKYTSSGSATWATFLDGSENNEYPAGRLACDSSGNLYTAGATYSSGFTITTASGIVSRPPTSNLDNVGGVYVIKYTPSGTALWAQFIDGVATEFTYSMTTDAYANVYICGFTNTSGIVIQTASGPVQRTTGGSDQAAFVGKFTSSGILEWIRFVDGISADVGLGVAVDLEQNAYLTGFTVSTPLTVHTTTGVYSTSLLVDNAGVLVKFNRYGVPDWAKFVEGTGSSTIFNADVDSSNNLYICGRTTISGYTFGSSYTRPGVKQGAFLVKYAQNTTIPGVARFVLQN